MHIQDFKQGSPCALSISNMHNMPAPSPTLSGSHKGANTSSKEPVPRNVTYKTYEYICMPCHSSHKGKKNQRCQLKPVQVACYCLQFHLVCEHRLVSLRIPFIVIFCLVRYGRQYKIQGGCTNVWASLDQIVNMLPRMSSGLQFHPMKLKRKMCHKSSYVHYFIQKDVVIEAF